MRHLTIDEKINLLKNIIRAYDQVLVAVSGSVQSLTLASIAHEVLGDKAIAVTVDTPSLAQSDLDDSIDVLRRIGMRHELIPLDEMDEDIQMGGDTEIRCYWCKHSRYTRMLRLASALGARKILDGTHIDDLSLERPGLRAVNEFRSQISSPFLLANFKRLDIRQLAHSYGLRVWDKPDNASLASRIHYDLNAERAVLRPFERAEHFLKKYMSGRLHISGDRL
jgi:uncharacterized protein